MAKKKAKKKVARRPGSVSRTRRKSAAPARKIATKKVATKKVATKKVAKKKVAKKKVATKKVAKKKVVRKSARPRVVRKPSLRSTNRRGPSSASRKAFKKRDSARFRVLLLRKRESLVGDLKSLESQAFKTSGQDASANHIADHGSDNYEQEFTFGLIENDEEAMRQINEALMRIDNGQYGLCQECGFLIPVPRLEVLPWAGYCIKCQEQNERF